MLTPSRFIPVVLFVTASAFVVAADSPPPLVKPVVPAANSVRVRVPLTGNKNNPMQLKARIPKPKGKKNETTDITVNVGIQSSRMSVSLQQWKAWGFEVPEDRVGVLPELIIPAAQLSPKPAKGRDAEFRLTNLKLRIVEVAGGENAGVNNTIGLSLSELTDGADRVYEPRIYFADRFLELTVSSAAVKRLNTGDATSPEPKATAGEKLVPAFAPMTGTGYPLMEFVSVNGQTQYTNAMGKVVPVRAGMSSGGWAAPGIVMSVTVARGCGVELSKEDGVPTGKVKELRFGLLTGSGFKARKDLVLKDISIRISNNESESFIWLGPAFAEEFFKDGVYGCAADGAWRLHGRVKPDLLEDIKTRTPKKP